MENWTQLSEIPGYQISNIGRIKTCAGRLIKGYPYFIRVTVDGKTFSFSKIFLVNKYFPNSSGLGIIPDLKNEIWKDVAGFEGLYKVSNLGRIKSIGHTIIRSNGVSRWNAEKILTARKRSSNMKYLCYRLYRNGEGKSYSIHRLVAEAFLTNHNNSEMVNHKDGNTLNNTVENLEWCDARYNRHHADNVLKAHDRYKKAVTIYDLQNHVLYEANSVKHAAEMINGARCAITNVINGTYTQHKGYKFKYKVQTP